MANQNFKLAHEILEALFSFNVTIKSNTNKYRGEQLMYKTDISTCKLPFNNLLYYVNNPQGYDKLLKEWIDAGKGGHPLITAIDIKETKFKGPDVGVAIQLLSYENHVEEDIYCIGNVDTRHIILTPQGAKAYLTEEYLTKHELKRKNEQLHRSQVSTNRWMVALTIIIACGTIAPLLKSTPAPDKPESSQNVTPAQPVIKAAPDTLKKLLRKPKIDTATAPGRKP
jgi:hypothetical protein